jgi:hypothetical protein
MLDDITELRTKGLRYSGLDLESISRYGQRRSRSD